MPTATTSLTLAPQKPFGNLTCDFYKNDAGEFFMTREQIGQALEYTDPVRAISKIHDRNADRLNLLSSVVSLTTEVGEHTQQRDFLVYNLKGIMEICRFSRQPKADRFMDFVWDVIISLMYGGTVLAPAQQQASVPVQAFQLLADTISQNNAATKLSLKNGRQSRKSNTIKVAADKCNCPVGNIVI